MFPAASLVTTLLLAIYIVASPVEVRVTRVSLPFAKRINTSGGTIKLVQHDQARAAALRNRGAASKNGNLNHRNGNDDITNQAVSYITSVGVGNPVTTYDLIIDTGSSNTWIGANKQFSQTSGGENTGELVSVPYGTGPYSSYFYGNEWLDTVTLSSNLVIAQQSIGVAESWNGFNNGVDGILGIGPTDLTLGSLPFAPFTEIPTVTDNLYQQGKISTEVVSISFEPTTTVDNINGELTFGTTDPMKYTGSISYTPITTTIPASQYWGIDQSIAYGVQTILSETAGIVDTGTTLLLLATDAYTKYQSATGATEDAATGMLKLTSAQYSQLQNLNFYIGSETFTLIPNAQIWPRALNTYIGGIDDAIYSIVGSTGTPSGQGLDFINGQVFLERFYSVFDTTNGRVGLAMTLFTNANVN